MKRKCKLLNYSKVTLTRERWKLFEGRLLNPNTLIIRVKKKVKMIDRCFNSETNETISENNNENREENLRKYFQVVGGTNESLYNKKIKVCFSYYNWSTI